MHTVISNARQDALEPHKPAFTFYFADEPQYACAERRGRIAHMLKCYRAHPAQYRVRKVSTHTYHVSGICRSVVAVITA